MQAVHTPKCFCQGSWPYWGGWLLAEHRGGGERVMHPPVLESAVAVVVLVKYGKRGVGLP